MLFCRDCKWSKKLSFFRPFLVCHHPQAWQQQTEDPVTGENKAGKYAYCDVMRMAINHECGREAKLWEPRANVKANAGG